MKNEMNSLIKLDFSDGSFDDFYVYSIEITEGITMPYKAILSILTVEPYKRNTLKEMLQKSVSIKIEQKFDDKTFNIRYLKGIVTYFQDKGVIFSEEGIGKDRKNCSHYMVTVESSLSLMSSKNKTRTFKGKTPLEVIKEVGKEYNIEFEDVCQNKPDYYGSKDVIFQQRNESDLRFLNRIFLAYGLNYYFYHDEVGFEPKINITNGKNFKPYSKIVYSSGKTQTDTVPCSLTSFKGDKNSLLLSKWEFSEKLDHAGGNDISYSTGCLFEYNKSMGRGAEIIIEAQIRKNIDTSMKYCNVDWVGEAGNIVLTPGTYLEVAGISLDPTDKLSCVLRETSLYYETVWPSHMALPPTRNENDPMIKQKLRALEFDSIKTETDSFSFNISNTFTEDDNISAQGNSATPLSNDNFLLTVATVSDKNGDILKTGTVEVCDEIDKNNPMMFYAVIDCAEKTPVIVNLVIPFGGNSRGLYYFPKIGERVLLTASHGRYYLFGYVSNQNEFGDFYTGMRDDMIDSTIFRRGFSDGSSKDKSMFHEIKMSDAQKDNIKHLIMYGLIDDYASETIIKHNDALMRRNYETNPICTFDGKKISLKKACVQVRNKVTRELSKVKTKTLDYENKCKIYSEAVESEREKAKSDMDTAKQEMLSARSNLDKSNINLAEVTEQVKGILRVDNIEAGASDFSITSDANISIGAKQELKQSANKYSLTAPAGIQVTSDGDIKINAKKTISLTVGGNAITLSQNGIIIRSRKWASSMGPFDASVILDSVTGVVIWGMNIIIKGALGTLVSDTLGASVLASNGAVIVKANTASVSTNTGMTAIANATNLVTQFVSQCTSISKDLPKQNADYYKRTSDGFMNLWNAGYAIDPLITKIKPMKNGNAKSELIATAMIPQVVNMIIAMLDTTHFCLDAAGDPLMTKMFPNGMTGRDIMRLVSVLLKMSVTILGMSGLTTKMSMMNATSIAITKNLIVSAGEIKATATASTSHVGPLGGAAVPAPAEDEINLDQPSLSRQPSTQPTLGNLEMSVDDGGWKLDV